MEPGDGCNGKGPLWCDAPVDGIEISHILPGHRSGDGAYDGFHAATSALPKCGFLKSFRWDERTARHLNPVVTKALALEDPLRSCCIVLRPECSVDPQRYVLHWPSIAVSRTDLTLPWCRQLLETLESNRWLTS